MKITYECSYYTTYGATDDELVVDELELLELVLEEVELEHGLS